MKLWYLYNSGFALKIENKLLVFDYYNDTPYNNILGLDGGVIRDDTLSDLEVYVFVSHNHYDHHNKVIYSWINSNAKEITYIISNDVSKIDIKNSYYLDPNMDYNIKGLNIKTLKSNDEGIAFYISIDNFHILHSGDLNFWRWEDESKEWNDNIEKIYKDQINELSGLPIDLAFIPIDPRLEKNYDLSLKYFTENIMPKNCIIVPMHFADNYKVFDDLHRDKYFDNYNILNISKRGQSFSL